MITLSAHRRLHAELIKDLSIFRVGDGDVLQQSNSLIQEKGKPLAEAKNPGYGAV